MTDYVAQLLGAAGAGGGLVGGIWAILKFARSKNELSKQQIDGFIATLQTRVTVLKAALNVESERRHAENLECQRRLMEMQRTIGSLEATVIRLETAGLAANVVADCNGVITEWNEGATVLFGWGRTESIGQPISMLVPLKLREEHERAFAHADGALSDPKNALQARVLESYALRRDGSEIPVTITLRGWSVEGRRMFSAEIRRR